MERIGDGLGGMSHLQAECDLRGARPTRLSFAVNGETLARFTTPRRFRELHGGLLLASSSKVHLASIIAFDNLKISTYVKPGFFKGLLDTFASE